MKKVKILAVIALMFFSFASAMGQSNSKDVTKFLGIPVDGTKSAMIQKLKAKGFTYNAQKEILTGEFNGRKVNISVVTNNNKVYRIVVDDVISTDEGNIRIRFNRLCSQFNKNNKYMPTDFVGDFKISDKEDISYEMTVHNKRYQAVFYQVNETALDSVAIEQYVLAIKQYVQEALLSEYSQEELENADEKLQQEIYEKAIDLGFQYMETKIAHKIVWFMITEEYGKYKITMFYDNELNKANGEDL